MRRYIVTFTSILSLLLAVVAGPMVLASASVSGAIEQSPNATTTRSTVQTPPTVSSGTATTQPGAGSSYVALGDSVAAGAGLPPLANATATDEICDRSASAYPYIIARSLQTTVAHLACSGAKVDEGIYGTQERSGTTIPAQLEVAFTNYNPTLITATIGANDARWTQFIRQCYVLRCGTSFDDLRAKIYRADLRVELFRMLSQIRANGGGSPPRVLLSGYYSPIDTTECLTSNRITSAEVAWLNEQTASLNQAIRSVIPYFSFAEFIPIDFTGHELCSADPWVQGLDGTAPIHPTSTGQTAIAQAFIAVLGR